MAFFNEDAVLYAALCIGVLLLVEGVYQLVVQARHGPRAQINRRMRMLAGGTDPMQVLVTLRREPRRHASGLAPLAPLLDRLNRLVAQAGAPVSTGRVVLWMGLLGGASLAALRLGLGLPTLPAALIALLVGPGLPLLWLRLRRQKRLRQLEEQLPDAIDLLVRSLRVGHPLSAALGAVAREMPDPIGTEFGIVVDEITYGQEVPDAIERMVERIDLQDLRYLSVVVGVQYESGGNLAEALNALARVMRERFQLFRKASAITAEGRLSAWFLSLFPVLMIFAMQAVKPDYYAQVADHPLFRIMALATVALLIVNVLYMRAVTQIKV